MDDNKADKYRLSPEKVAKRQITPRNLDTAPTYYANFAGVVGSHMDICLQFGQIEESTEDVLKVNYVSRVYFSPMHARAVRDLLIRKIAEYEQVYPGWKMASADDQAPTE